MSKVALIGGAGAEGSHFGELYHRNGLEVLIADTNQAKADELCRANNYRLVDSEYAAAHADLVIFTLPIDATVPEIRRLGPLVKTAMADLTSIKSNAVAAMLESRASKDIEVFSIHGMYRPEVSPWNQNVLTIPVSPHDGGRWYRFTEQMMDQERAYLSRLENAAAHDAISLRTQSGPHAATYLYLATLAALCSTSDAQRVLHQYSTIFSRGLNEAAARLVANPGQGGMYGLIQMENPGIKELYDTMEEVLAELRSIVESKDTERFKAMHKKLSLFLGDLSRTAEEIDRTRERPMGIEIFYDIKDHDLVHHTLDRFRTAARPYKAHIETTTIYEGDVSKLSHSPHIALARHTVLPVKGMIGGYGADTFYIKNKHLEPEKSIRLTPTTRRRISSNDPKAAELRAARERRDRDHTRVQLINRVTQDPILNAFDTWDHKPGLPDLGRLVVYHPVTRKKSR